MANDAVKTWTPSCVASTVPPTNVDQLTKSDAPSTRVPGSDVNAQSFKSAEW
jgi:hypothetical protein